MAIQISYTDEAGVAHASCYVKIVELKQIHDIEGNESLEIKCEFFHTSATRTAQKQPVKKHSYFVSTPLTSIVLDGATDILNAAYNWLMANEADFSSGTEV